jgi:hypothetical protein
MPNWKAVWIIARKDIGVWLRQPSAVAATILPALAFLIVLYFGARAVGRNPVALVVEDTGPHAEQLAERLDHPSIACWKLHAVQLGHVLYQPHLRFPRPLPIQYWEFTPELFRIIVDPRQAPHSV